MYYIITKVFLILGLFFEYVFLENFIKIYAFSYSNLP